MSWHPEILGRRQKRVLALISPLLSRRGFFLVGGTAVALHFGHRRPVDFDWFTLERFDPLALAEDLRQKGIDFHTDQVATGTLHGASGGVQVSMIRHNYPMLAKLRRWPGGIHIAARADLAAMKLAAVAQRGAKKDFVDVYALGQRSTLKQMLCWYQKKFALADIAHLLCSLTYFDDADRERMPKMLWNVRWRNVKNAIRAWVLEIPR
jgi:hypothetical protein